MWNKFLASFLCALMIALPVSAKAEEPPADGRVTSIEFNQRAPYSGILLDTQAMAKVLAENKYLSLQYDLKLDMELSKLRAQNDLAKGLLQARIDTLTTQSEEILKVKNDEINRLQESDKDRPNSNSEWWLAGGVVICIVVSISVFFAAAEGFKN